jgi:thiamine biosynthesis lipoprotein
VSRSARLGVLTALLAAAMGLWLIRASGVARGWVDLSFESMATRVVLTVPDDDRARTAAELVRAAFVEVDGMMSEWKPGSPLSAVNANAGVAPARVPAELLGLIEESLALGAATEGAFDITWAALWGVWDFRGENPGVPADSEIEARRGLVDYRKVVVDRGAGTVFLPELGMMIGLGAIAKGFALDVAAARLRAEGFTDFLIVAGGQVYGAGDRDGRPWRVGIRSPRGGAHGEAGDAFAVIELRDRSASTSGDYERFFEIEGVRYHHVIDPRTGWPSRGAMSATVVAERATLADALSTAGLVMGVEGAFDLAGREGLWMLVVDGSGLVHVTETPGVAVEWVEEGP